MRFLMTLFWAVFAAALVLFARENWVPVTLNLWSGLQADVKLPFLLVLVFLLGFLPTYLLYRGRMWSLRRQLVRPERLTVANQPVVVAPPPGPPTADPTAPAPATAPVSAAPVADAHAAESSL
jgi:putative membrane protein